MSPAAPRALAQGSSLASDERGMPSSPPHAPSSHADEDDFLTVRGDIAEAQTARKVVEQALNRFARIDCLVNDAGVFIGKPFTDYTLDDYVLITSVNLAGFFHLTQRVIGQMVTQGSGHVVNVTTSLVDNADSKTPAALPALTKGGLAAVDTLAGD